MKIYGLYAVTLAVAWGAAAGSAEAGIFRHHRAAPRCAPPACAAPAYCTPTASVGGHYEDRVVTCTVYVPETQTVTRKVVTCVMEQQQRERTYNVTKRVPYTETQTQEYVVMVQKTQMRKLTQTVCKPVTKEVQQAYTVMVPHQEVRKGVRHIPVCEPVTFTRTVCVDRGHWETRTIQVPCAPYGGCGSQGGGYYGGGYGGYYGGTGYAPPASTAVYRGSNLTNVSYAGTVAGYAGVGYAGAGYAGAGYAGVGYAGAPGCGNCAPPTVTQCVRVWVPCIVHEQVQQTVMRTKLVPQDYQYSVTVCKPEQRTRTVQVCETVAEQVTTEVPVTVCVPEKRTRTVDVTKYKCVSEPKTETYTVMVPRQVEQEVPVQVCRMVPKTVERTIRVWVPDCGPAAEAAPSVPTPAAQPTPAPAPQAVPAAKPALL